MKNIWLIFVLMIVIGLLVSGCSARSAPAREYAGALYLRAQG